MTLVGYARVSTREQDASSQVASLEAAGVRRVFVDHAESSRRTDRPQWLACLDYLRAGDTLLVWKLDRIAGSDRHMLEIVRGLEERGVDLRSLSEPVIDTTTAMGKALFGIVAVLAQLRVDSMRENTMRGLAHARAQGRVGGRPPALSPEGIDVACRMREAGAAWRSIAETLSVSESTAKRAVGRARRVAAGEDG